MAGTTLSTTGSSTAGPQSTIQQYFDKKLLEQTLKTIVLDQFAFKAPLPGKAGAKTIRFFRYPESNTTDVLGVTEGTLRTDWAWVFSYQRNFGRRTEAAHSKGTGNYPAPKPEQ